MSPLPQTSIHTVGRLSTQLDWSSVLPDLLMVLALIAVVTVMTTYLWRRRRGS